jgi:hypothetical protein
MTNMIRRTTLMPKAGPGGVGVAVLNDKRLYIDRTGNGSASKEVVRTAKVIDATSNVTLTPADDGAVVVLNSTTALTISLPATLAGLQFTFVIKQLPSSGTHAISPVAADKIFAPGFTAADNKDIVATATADAVGDFVTLTGDGVDGYFVTAIGEATPDNWARQA